MLATTGVLAAACGPAGGGQGAALVTRSEPATVQFWFNWGGWQTEGMQKVNDAFEQQAPEITIEMTPLRGQEKFDKIVAAVTAGTPPDVVNLGGSRLIQFARRNIVQSLNDRIARSKVARKDKFYPAQWEAASWEGKIYGIPALEHGPSPFFYWNKAHFQEEGFPPDRAPKHLDEVQAYAEQLTEQQGPGGQIVQLGFDPRADVGNGLLGYWANAYDVTWYDPQAHKVNLVQPGLVAAVEYISAIYQRLTPQAIQAFRKQYPKWNSAKSGFAQDVASMKVSSYTSAGVLAKNAPDLRLGIGWAPPTPAKQRTFVRVGGSWCICLAAGAPAADAAFRFIEYVTTPPAAQIILDHIGWIDYNKEVAEQLNVEQVPNLRFVLDAPKKAQKLLAPVVLPIETTAVNDGLDRVLAGQQSARDMLQQVERELQA
ncbi:MAG: extracellular solute-binding protein, partial [Chloroflexota bacterium]